jgi:hypothetical protein
MSGNRVEHNPYQPPVARVDGPSEQAEHRFYVVAPGKFLLLMIGTLTSYSIYWFYRNWSQLNRHHKQYWPIPRAIFQIFFTHSLFAEVDRTIKQRGVVHAWSWRGWATLFVVTSIVSSALDRLAFKEIGSPWTDLTSLAMVAPVTWALLAGQRAINLADGDPQGFTNSQITLANMAWLALFGIMWLLVLFGLYLAVNPSAFD